MDLSLKSFEKELVGKGSGKRSGKHGLIREMVRDFCFSRQQPSWMRPTVGSFHSACNACEACAGVFLSGKVFSQGEA